MVIDKYRSRGDRYLIPLAERFRDYHPNTLTALALLFAFLAGFSFVLADEFTFPSARAHVLLVVASVCVFLNAGFDAIDGTVARLTASVSARGDFLDHVTDRYADLFILGGIMFSAYCNIVIGALAIFAVMLTSYMGTQAQALGIGRDYSGLLGRADRLMLLLFAPLVQFPIMYFYEDGNLPYIHLTVLELVMIWFFIAGNITAIHRAWNIWDELSKREKKK